MIPAPTPAASPAPQRPVYHQTQATAALGRPHRSKGRAGPQTAMTLDATEVRCLFLDRSGVEREVGMDCRPARFTRLEFAEGPISGMIRRTWIDSGMDPQGRVLYLERPPERYLEPKATLNLKRELLGD